MLGEVLKSEALLLREVLKSEATAFQNLPKHPRALATLLTDLYICNCIIST